MAKFVPAIHKKIEDGLRQITEEIASDLHKEFGGVFKNKFGYRSDFVVDGTVDHVVWELHLKTPVYRPNKSIFYASIIEHLVSSGTVGRSISEISITVKIEDINYEVKLIDLFMNRFIPELKKVLAGYKGRCKIMLEDSRKVVKKEGFDF